MVVTLGRRNVIVSSGRLVDFQRESTSRVLPWIRFGWCDCNKRGGCCIFFCYFLILHLTFPNRALNDSLNGFKKVKISSVSPFIVSGTVVNFIFLSYHPSWCFGGWSMYVQLHRAFCVLWLLCWQEPWRQTATWCLFELLAPAARDRVQASCGILVARSSSCARSVPLATAPPCHLTVLLFATLSYSSAPRCWLLSLTPWLRLLEASPSCTPSVYSATCSLDALPWGLSRLARIFVA